MEHSPLTWGERGQLWLRLGLRGVLALGGLDRKSTRLNSSHWS